MAKGCFARARCGGACSTQDEHDHNMRTLPKRCCECDSIKPLDEFASHVRNGRTWWQSVCRPCHGLRQDRYRRAHPERHHSHRRRRDLWNKYGLTVDRFLEMVEAQGGLCPICGVPATDVDHNHATGSVREILCGRCNRTIGSMDDSPSLLRAAADYLERHQ